MRTRKTSFSVHDAGELTSVIEYLGRCLKIREDRSQAKLLYRGQPRGSDPLLPTIGRAWSYSGRSKRFTQADEIKLLHRFRRRAYPLLGKLSPLEALFVARHHGLPTRLLDWTGNALFALLFACSGVGDLEGAVWVLEQRDDLEEFSLDPFALAAIETEEGLLRPHASRRRRGKALSADQVKILFPIFNSTRIVAQDGIFTLHANPHRPLEDYGGVPFPRGEMDIGALHRMRIGAGVKRRIVEELNALGFTHQTVFPDLDGIVRSLWETEVLPDRTEPGPATA